MLLFSQIFACLWPLLLSEPVLAQSCNVHHTLSLSLSSYHNLKNVCSQYLKQWF